MEVSGEAASGSGSRTTFYGMCSINWGAADWGSVPAWAGAIALLITIWKIFDEAKQRRNERAEYQLNQARLVVMIIADFDDTGFNCEVSNFGSAHVAEVAPTIQPTAPGAGKHSFPTVLDHPKDSLRIDPGRTITAHLTARNSFSRAADFTPVVYFTDWKGKRWEKPSNGEPKPVVE